MFRMLPGIDFAGRHAIGPAAPVGALAAILVVSVVGLQVLQPSPREIRLGETEMAQRSAAVVASTYRANVDIDRRDRMLLVSYADAAPQNADRFAWAVCDTIRTYPDTAGSSKVLREWQVVTMPHAGMPGSCRIGG